MHEDKPILEMQEEVHKCYILANKLDSMNPTLKDAFTGTPSERIERQLKEFGFFMCQVKFNEIEYDTIGQLEMMENLANILGMFRAANYMSTIRGDY